MCVNYAITEVQRILEEALKQEQETPFKNTKEKIMINQVLLCALKEYVNSDHVDVELNPRKRMAIEAIAEAEKQEQGEIVAMRYDFDGYGYKYIDSGSGSDWQTREKGAEPLYEQTKEWTDLSVDDIEDIAEQFHDIDYDINENPYDIFDYKGYALALQAKLKKHNS